MRKINEDDLVKEEKEIQEKVDKALERPCLLCKQPMKCIGKRIWFCKRCKTFTQVSNVVEVKK